jgi:hypothetical protein
MVDRGHSVPSAGGGGRLSGGFGIGDTLTPPSPGRGRKPMATFPAWGSPTGSPGQGQPSEALRSGFGAMREGSVPREWDLYRFMHEIAKGMEYLHANGVLHGDLKVSFNFTSLDG